MHTKAVSTDILEDLTKKAYQLSALLDVITGDGQENFLLCNNLTKDNYLWICRDLSDEIGAELQKI